MNRIKTYYNLTKPGIIRGNLITASAGFFLASKGVINITVLFAILGGTVLVIGSGCVFNNYLDRNIDKKMDRTKKRALVTGEVSLTSALFYGAILGILGLILLVVYTNNLTAVIGLVGFVFYVVVYGVAKRKSVHGTLVGSISGAIPPVAGYTAVSGNLDLGALLLFVVLTAWQMPHFYAIAIYRLKDYQAAGIPVLPSVKSVDATIKQIIFYISLFIISTSLLYYYNFADILYLIATSVAGLIWLYIALKGLKSKDEIKWAHSVFGVSLLVLLVFSVSISISSFII